MIIRCPACDSPETKPFYELRAAPTNSCILFHSQSEALACETGDILLNFCDRCGFIYNSKFEPEKTEYSDRYEETQGFSPTFSRFHRDLASRLIERYDLRGKRIVEVGCGKGEFLLLMAQLGGNEGVGVDPSIHKDRIVGLPGAEKVTLIPEYYSDAHRELEADAIICKMTLEHISEPFVFISVIRRNLEYKTNTLVFFQIPETSRILKICAFEDIYYEHCSYFSPAPLERLFRRSGFDIDSIDVIYDEQYLTIEAHPSISEAAPNASTSNADLTLLRTLVADFPDRAAKNKKIWRDLVLNAKAADKRIILWGSGSKAVAFLTTLSVGDAVDHVVDINPHRHDRYMPMTGQRIVGPSEVPEISPDLVIVMNRIYEPEIAANLRQLGCAPQIVSL